MQQRYLYIFMMLREEIQKMGSVQWFDWKQMKKDVEMMIEQKFTHELHTNMQDFYESYLWKSVESRDAWDFIHFVAQRDNELGIWATGKVNLWELTEHWIEQDDSRTLQALLTRLGQTGYETDWQQLRTTLDEKLCRMEVDGTRNGTNETGYFYCLLHACTMIMMSVHTTEEKMTLLSQFSQQWHFLRTVYSVMVRRIVGMKYTNFAQLAHYTVGGQQEFDPYLHLFYSPLKERFEELVEMGTKRESLTKAMKKIEKRMQQTTPSHELDRLCEVLFPEEFLEMLNRHRPKSYGELEGEIKQIKEDMNVTVNALNRQVKELATQLSAAIESSVPIKQIENELLNFQSAIALNIYMQLNMLLTGNSAWAAQSLTIRDKILVKQKEEMLLNMNITAQPGSYVNGMVKQQANYSIDPNRQITS